MKNLFSIILISILLFAACSKEVSNVSQLATVAYPTIVLNGDSIVSTPVGTGTYTDPGAVGVDNITGAQTPLTPLSNDVNLTTPGFYTVQYEFRNKDGFRADRTRFVLVTPISSAVDLSGTYVRQSNGVAVQYTKVGTGLYIIANVGGVATGVSLDSSAIIPVYMGQLSDSTIQIPAQNGQSVQPGAPSVGTIYCDYGSPSMPFGKLSGTLPNDTISYVVENGNFGTSVRTFVRQ